MKDSLSFVVAVVVSAILLYLYPLTASLDRQQQLIFLMTQQAVTRFVDDVCAKGFLSAPMYREFEEQLATSGLSIRVDLKHVKKRWITSKENGDMIESMEEYYNPQILEVLFPADDYEDADSDGTYYFAAGDEFYVTVKSEETAGNQDSVPLVWLPYGGIVKNAPH